MSKYAPANEDGDKPYVVTYRDWMTQRRRIVYAPNAASAKFRAQGRPRPGMGHAEARRATPEDMGPQS